MSSDEAAVAAASTAAEGIRSLNHATVVRRLFAPGDVYEVLGHLAVMAGRLPQALDQLEASIRDQYEKGELQRARGRSVAESIALLELALADARAGAEALRAGLSEAQGGISDLALAGEDE